MKDLLASVLSEKNKLKGQNHRSSGNFNTLLIPSLETESFTWEVQDADGNALNDITFDVMQDLCADIDPVLFKGLKNGSSTAGYESENSLYIANPTGASEQFLVSVYANFN